MSKLINKSFPSLFKVIRPKYTLLQPLVLPYTFKAHMSTQVKESKGLQSDVMKFLYTHKQRPIPTAESNTVLTNCPHCIDVRKNSFAAHLNIQKGTYKCTTCKSKGTFQEFSRNLLKKVSQPDEYPILSASDMLHAGTSHSKFSRPIEEINLYPQALTKDTDKLEHLENKHGMDKSTWELFKVGITDVDGVSCLTFPQTDLLYDTEKESFELDTVRLKVCELDSPTNVIEHDPPLHSKESLAGLFGYQTASTDSDTLILTRRELDAMAAYQATGIPSVAIPTSNYQLQESVLPLLQRFTRVYIWLDDDVDGQLASERFAHKIGDSKCLIVNTRLGDKNGPINAYEALQEKKDLAQIVESARRVKHDQIVDFHDLREEVYNDILHPEQTRGVQSSDLPGLNQIMKGHRPGELTILTGPTGAGKTTIISQLSLDYCQSGVPTLWGSFEILNKRLAKKMLFQYAGKDISLNPSEFHEIADKFQQVLENRYKLMTWTDFGIAPTVFLKVL